jgi:hypothetical protein
MKKLLTLVGEQAVDVVLIEYPDRLVRFGFSYLDQAFGWQHVRASSPRSAPNPGADRRAAARHAHHCDRLCRQTLWVACERAAHPRSKRTEANANRLLREAMGQAKRTSKLLLDLGKRTQGGANTGKRAYLDETAQVLNQGRADLTSSSFWHMRRSSKKRWSTTPTRTWKCGSASSPPMNS